MKLEHLVTGQERLRNKLAEAEQVKGGISEEISKRLDASNTMLVDTIKGLVTEQTNTALFSSSVHQTVLSIAQNSQIILRELEQAVRNMNDASVGRGNSLKDSVGKVSTKAEVNTLSEQVLALGILIDRLPTAFPEQKETDLSGLAGDIKTVRNAVQDIKFPEMPKTMDISGQLLEMEQRMGQRVYVFDVERDPMSGTIDKIVVTEGAV